LYLISLKGTKDCKPPSINLSLSHDIEDPTVIVKSQDFTVTSRIDISKGCKLNNTLEWEWYLSRLPEGGIYFEPRRAVTRGTTKYTLTIRKQTLDYGIYYIEQRVGLSNTRFFHHNYGFLDIQRTPLQGFITGPSIVARGYTDILAIDVSTSYDPDVVPYNTDGMTFDWSCKRVSDDVNQPNQSVIGCFGTSLVELTQQQGPVLKLPVLKLMPNHRYNITVIVRKDTRNKALNLVVKVDQGATMAVKIA